MVFLCAYPAGLLLLLAADRPGYDPDPLCVTRLIQAVGKAKQEIPLEHIIPGIFNIVLAGITAYTNVLI